MTTLTIPAGRARPAVREQAAVEASTAPIAEPTLALVLRSWYNDPTNLRGSTARVLRHTRDVAQALAEHPRTQLSLAIPGFEFDLLRCGMDALSLPGPRLATLDLLRRTRGVSFVCTPYTEDHSFDPEILSAQFARSAATRRALALPRVTPASMLPQSAVRRLAGNLSAHAQDLFIAQRSIAPHSLSPALPEYESVGVYSDGVHDATAFVANARLNQHFKEYARAAPDSIRGVRAAAERTLTACLDDLRQIERVEGLPLGLALLDVETLFPCDSAVYMAQLIEVADRFVLDGSLVVRGIDDAVAGAVRHLAAQKRHRGMVDELLPIPAEAVPFPLVGSQRERLAAWLQARPFASLNPYEQTLTLLACDRGYAKAEALVGARRRGVANARSHLFEQRQLLTALERGLELPALLGPIRSRAIKPRLWYMHEVADSYARSSE